ncbi:MAG: hypothetical protein PXX73_01485 [Sideroxydans sp.]|nr:hypothetical protein [Sideroxydans sp.]
MKYCDSFNSNTCTFPGGLRAGATEIERDLGKPSRDEIFILYHTDKLDGTRYPVRRIAYYYDLPNETVVFLFSVLGEGDTAHELVDHFKKPVVNYLYPRSGDVKYQIHAPDMDKPILVKRAAVVKKK